MACIGTTAPVAPRAPRLARSRARARPARAGSVRASSCSSSDRRDVVRHRAGPARASPAAPATLAVAAAALAPTDPAHAAVAHELAQVAANGPLESARLFVALASVALILFQGPKGDGVVNSLNENRVFGSASEAKNVVDYVTAGLIGGFIVLSAILAAQS